MDLLLSAFALALRSVLVVAEGVWWLLAGAVSAGRSVGEIVHLVGVLREGEVRCPRGHLVATSGETYRCDCGFTYDGGSIWLCPHCQAVTSFVSCATCGLSVENPYRHEDH